MTHPRDPDTYNSNAVYCPLCECEIDGPEDMMHGYCYECWYRTHCDECGKRIEYQDCDYPQCAECAESAEGY